LPYAKERTREEYIANRTKRAECGCLLWTLGNGEKRYPVAYFHGEVFGVGHHLYEEKYGAVPAGLLLRHTCDTPRCVDPDHLIPGTSAQNRADFMQRHPRARELCLAAAKIGAVGVKARWDRLSKEERATFVKERSEKQHALRTPEKDEYRRVRSAEGRWGNHIKRQFVTMTAEERSMRAKARQNARSPEERRASALKTWETRRARSK
jgi:hypothetical protein